MNKHVLIVESDSDKYFLEALIQHLNLASIEVGPPVCRIDDFECLSGLDEKKLLGRLKQLKDKFPQKAYRKVGIILDANNQGIEARVAFIRKVLGQIFTIQTDLTAINTFVRDETLDVDFACYITNINGEGELETLLREIKGRPALAADCLEKWRECLRANGKEIKRKTFDKFWLQIYFRYDCCKENEPKADENCRGEKAFKKTDTWNFDHPVLEDLKTFLRFFA